MRVAQYQKLRGTSKELAFIASNFMMLPHSIEQLEESNFALVDSLQIFMDSKRDVSVIAGEKGSIIWEKLQQIVKGNPFLQKVGQIATMITGDSHYLTLTCLQAMSQNVSGIR